MMNLTINCDLCERPVLDLCNVKRIHHVGLACCIACSTSGEWALFDWHVEGFNDEPIPQFVYEEEDSADWWKK